MAYGRFPPDAGAEPIGNDREERERALRPVAEQRPNLRRRKRQHLGHEGRVDLVRALFDGLPFVEERAEAPEAAFEPGERAEVALVPAVQRRREAFYGISQDLAQTFEARARHGALRGERRVVRSKEGT